MTNTKISPVMRQTLIDLGRGHGFYRTAPQTSRALENRGMIGWDRKTCSAVLTAAGWAWLKDNEGIERPADAGRLTVEEALAESEMGRVQDWDLTSKALGATDLPTGQNYPTFGEAVGAALAHNAAQSARMAEDPEPPRRDGWLDEEAGSGPGAGPEADPVMMLGDHRKMTSAPNYTGQFADHANQFKSHPMESLIQSQPARIRPDTLDMFTSKFLRLPGVVEIEDSIVFPDSFAGKISDLDVPLSIMSETIREANRLTETRDAFTRGSVYREHVPEDDMYVDRTAWKAEETRIAALREQLRTSAQQRNTFESRNGRAPLCGREMSTGRPCPQHTPEDTREQYTKRDTYGDPIAYRDVPVPADLAGHWYGVEAISWTRGVNASYVQAVRIARGLES